MEPECLGKMPAYCTSCAAASTLQVLSNGAKQHYLGHHCPNCGPMSRETRYLPDKKAANLILRAVQEGDDNTWHCWRR